MSDQYLYVYGVVERDEIDLEMEGVEGATEVYPVDYGPFSAVVSDVETLEPEETDENSRAHDEVIRAVMEGGEGRTFVPMRFGMVFKNGRTLKSVLREARPAFSRALHDLDGTVELGVKLVAPEETSIDREAVAEDVSERLSAASVGEVDNGLFSDRLVFNASYLVERESREAFDEAVEGIEDDYGEEVTVQYTGPYAPYNFVDIEIGAQR
ncbi:GvpL/GvpF family gas vesicle protein [Halomarina halobia]|uniref:GvpL/GvpF family gas vesicle protein n=1 Tax=Halomarina halobia TaxID=3033386 RepID=A0ABD6A517_9EURY|nr:GvpL/GvpF family gas vesicle protein [Halomarina sp. PSR21]